MLPSTYLLRAALTVAAILGSAQAALSQETAAPQAPASQGAPQQTEQQPNATPPQAEPAENGRSFGTQDLTPAIQPTPRLDQPWWAARHETVLNEIRARSGIRLLMIGDSITQNYEKANPPDENFAPIWQQFYAPRNALNLGFSGDTTANLLWRLTHGELDGLRPQAAVVLIGTNNTGHAQQTAEQTEAGLMNVIGTLTQRLPLTRILVLAILPSDVSPEKTAADKAVNAWLEKRYGNKPLPAASTTAPTTPLQVDQRVTYLDISKTFLNADGTLNAAIFYDPRLAKPGKPLHPDTVGQRKMAEAIEATLAKLMYDQSKTGSSEKPGGSSDSSGSPLR